jgi:hypothetical protein
MSESLDKNSAVQSYLSEQTLDRMSREMLEGIFQRTNNRIIALEWKKELNPVELQKLDGFRADLAKIQEALSKKR